LGDSLRQSTWKLAVTEAPWSDLDVPLVVIDLASVETYLLVRDLSALAVEAHGARWCPLISQPAPLDLDIEAASACANRLQLPFVRPERHPAPVRKAMRVATLAAARGQAALFTVRATRLAWSTGADLDRLGEGQEVEGEEDDPAAYLPLMMEEIGIEPGEARRAATEGSDWDLELTSIAGSLGRLGIQAAPALRWRGRLHVGRDAILSVLPDSKSHEGHVQPPRGSSDQG
jgi:2-hydroxychromene-2-carboxylate isomerase